MTSRSRPIKRSPDTQSPNLQQIPPAPSSFAFDPNQFGSDNMDGADFDPALFQSDLSSVHPQSYMDLNNANLSTSNQLVRRPMNNQLIARGAMQPQQQWMSPEQQAAPWNASSSEEQELDRRATIAKREAQAKRKQIPPFVLKLWSFLNEDKNSDLIRWTDNGRAFTVLDEDEFARALIPELFKHNNYASFVRQLNMYGFHKKVGLSANSMKAAEKKTKDPNVYWHDYFRQGKEDLLWLIQKPQSKATAAKRKRGQDGKEEESDDEKRPLQDTEHTQSVTRLKQGDSDLVLMPRSEVENLRHEVNNLQRQQSVISKMISHLKDQNEQFYRQASEFQSLHDRHENSINAILTFLATFYNRSLEAGVDLSNMFGQNNPNQPKQHGTVVDVGDGDFHDASTQQLQKYRKPQLLLRSSPSRGASSSQTPKISTQPSSARSSISPPDVDDQKRNSIGNASTGSNIPKSTTASPALKDESATPQPRGQYPDNGDMMSLINAANANTPSSSSPHFDFSDALNHAQNANGQGPLTPQQRSNMLNLIANQQAAASKPGANNALVTPTPPPMPDLEQYARNQEQLEMLQRLQKEQDSKVQDLAGRLQPLSPSGTIPGLSDSYMGGDPGDFDFDAFLQNPYSADGGADGAGDDDPTGLNFDFGAPSEGDDLFGDVGAGVDSDGPKVESIHSDEDKGQGGA